MATLDSLKRECRTLEMYVDQRLQARVPQASKPSVDLESGGSSLDPDATRLREVDEALTKLSATVDDLSAAAAGSGVRTHAAVAGRYRDVVSDFRGEYRRQLAALRARRDNELLYADVRGRRGGPAETSATDILLRERGSLLTGGSAVDELLAQAERTREALATQRASVTHAMSRLGSVLTSVPGVNNLLRAINRRRLHNEVVLGLTIAACVCLYLYYLLPAKASS
jgi:hypothetical protein